MGIETKHDINREIHTFTNTGKQGEIERETHTEADRETKKRLFLNQRYKDILKEKKMDLTDW